MPKAKKNDSVANLGFEVTLWAAADALRGSMDAAAYKHVCLGLFSLKYFCDAFEERHAALLAEKASGADPEDPDEYRAQSIFWVPPEARWQRPNARARQPTIGQFVDDATADIERDNPALKGVLPRDYARPALDKTRLGQLIDLASNIQVGDEASRAKDVLGRVYEHFLSQFASAEGKKGGERRLALMNLAIRGIDGQIEHGDTFHNNRHPELKANFILANPPFNISDWGGERLRDDKRWQCGARPAGSRPSGLPRAEWRNVA